MATLEASASVSWQPSAQDGPPGVGDPSAQTIAQAAQATGVSVHTLRYYERVGLMLEPVARAASSHRRYTRADIAWVSFLTRLRLTGMPIREMARYAQLARAGAGTEADRLALLTEHRRRVLDRLQEEQRNLAAIDCKIAQYEEKIR
ncbi:MerR family transcriptional regulator [Frankia sp. R82]|uniref:MerR family transcriptional regulator n=1 Tax=Frankia sp. R82 TaxID=2950553 RepID=UPI002043E91A|nr:MerR family transcriptional regulator [Frankia sp. R82]MCM3886554.1 MerR family transcriptional regulator [Frankia sp. R82]